MLICSIYTLWEAALNKNIETSFQCSDFQFYIGRMKVIIRSSHRVLYMIKLFMDTCPLKESRHAAGFLRKEIKLKTFFFSKWQKNRHCNKNSLKSFIMIHFIYHFMITSKKTAENCLINTLLGHLLHHYHFHYLVCARHLKHICPEPTTAYCISAPYERIWFWSGICQGGQDSAQRAAWSWITLWSSYMAIDGNPSMRSLVYKVIVWL